MLTPTRSAFAALNTEGIRMISVCIGAFEAPMLQPMLDIEEIGEGLKLETPVLHPVQTDDIALVAH